MSGTCQVIRVSEHEVKEILAKKFGATSPYDVYLEATNRRGRKVSPVRFGADILIYPSQADKQE